MRKLVVLNSVTSDGHFSGMNGDLDWTGKNSKDEERSSPRLAQARHCSRLTASPARR